MKTSVIIPSYNPVLKLPATLEKLSGQASFMDELIIIIDNHHYGDFATSILGKYSGVFNLKVFPQANSGRGKSRNRGVELSTGDIIIFLDDDMLAEDGLLEKHVLFHRKNPAAILSGNGYRNPESAGYDFGKFLIDMENSWKERKKGINEVTLANFNFTSCNMSLPKAVFNQLGGFDIRFSDGEDFDFAVRALHAGIPVSYDNSLYAWHNDWPEIKAFIRRQNEYAKAKKEIFRVHPEYLKDFPEMLPTENGPAKKMMACLYKFLFTRFVTSDNSIFAALPVKTRYTLYKRTIAVNTKT